MSSIVLYQVYGANFFCRGQIGLEDCEVDAFKEVIDQGIDILKDKLKYVGEQLVNKLMNKQGRREIEDLHLV